MTEAPRCLTRDDLYQRANKVEQVVPSRQLCLEPLVMAVWWAGSLERTRDYKKEQEENG